MLRFLAKIYEKAVQFPAGGSITIIAVTTLSGGDITHAVPDNTGYITEGQLFLRRDSDIGKVIVDPFRSLSRLKQLVSGKKTRKDHPQVMNAAVRLYADAANAKTKMENGFDLTNYDERTLAFAKDYANQLLAIDVNLDTTEMLDVTWGLFSKYFKPEEVNIKKEYLLPTLSQFTAFSVTIAVPQSFPFGYLLLFISFFYLCTQIPCKGRKSSDIV